MSLTSASAAVAVQALHVFFGDAATYTAPPAAGITVTAVLSYRDQPVGIPGLDADVRNPGWEARIPQSAVVTRPRAGDTLTVGTTTYTVRDAWADVERTEWVLDLS